MHSALKQYVKYIHVYVHVGLGPTCDLLSFFMGTLPKTLSYIIREWDNISK